MAQITNRRARAGSRRYDPGVAAPGRPAPSPDARRRVLLAALTAVLLLNIALAATALVVLLHSPGPPTYTAAEHDAADARLCSRFRLASSVTHVETNGGGPALASIALTNGAVMLQTAANDPAVSQGYRDAALALATAYQDLTAKGSVLRRESTEADTLVAEVNDKEHTLQQLCEP